jgi:hypothetical protein
MIGEEYRMVGTCVIRGWCRKTSRIAPSSAFEIQRHIAALLR